MGLFGPPKTVARPANHQQQQAMTKTGGAGNLPWYSPTVESVAASRRPASAARTNTSGQYQAQARPASATRSFRQTAGAPAGPAAYAQTRPNFAAIPTAELHEESCICTICSCGKHACPPTPRVNHYDPNMTSEARQAYSGQFVPAVRASAPGQWKPHDAPFEGVTTNSLAYVNHGPIQQRRAAPRHSMMDTGVGRNDVPFDDTTTHKSDYAAHPLGARSAGGPRAGNLSTLGDDDRDFSTEGRNAYPAHPLQPKRSRAPEGLRPSIPFQGESSHKTDFPNHVGARPSIPKFRSHVFAPSPEDRDFGTENRGCFTPKRLEACPAIPVAVASKSRPGHVFVEKVTLQGTQTYRRKAY